MDFSIGEDRQMLADTLSRYLADNFDWKAREAAIESEAGFSREVWNGLGELGIFGALFPEEAGGFGGTAFDVGVVFAELGKALATGPFLGTLMAGRLLAAAGNTDDLGEIIAGSKIVTFADEDALDASGKPMPAAGATADHHSLVLSGDKGVVDYLGSADMVVATGQYDGAERAFLLNTDGPGVTVRDYTLVDGGSAGELALMYAPVKMLDADEAALAEARAMGLVAVCWEAVAVMDVLRDQTLDYLRTRKQFGVPIGKLQALQHRMATLALEIEQARSAAINAAANFEKDPVTRDRACAAAKYTAGKVGRLAAEEAIQMHGGIGMTWELPMSHYAKRLTMLNHVLGDDDHHLARYMALGQAA